MLFDHDSASFIRVDMILVILVRMIPAILPELFETHEDLTSVVTSSI